MALETSRSIYDWQRATFGEYTSHFRQVSRAIAEMAELVDAVTLGDSDQEIIRECADVAIVMYGYIEASKIDIKVRQVATLHDVDLNYLVAQANCGLGRVLLILASTHDTKRDLIQETATEVSWLYYLLEEMCAELHGNLADAVDEKMQINRARKWICNGSAHSKHVKIKEELPVDFSTIV